VRFVAESQETKILQSIVQWRGSRFNRGKPVSSLVTDVLGYLFGNKESALCPVLSVLYAGDHTVAAHFGLRYQGILHYWFPAFNPDFSKYSPGSILLYYLLSEYSALKYSILDFGPGGEQYKTNMSNSSLPITSGSFEAVSLVTFGESSGQK
jgi:CelD/BcsL family acetyltransferase involved in cellulose biosynthesis